MTDDIAVVGLDCRFPKAEDPAALWRLLLDGADGIDEIPAERWDAAGLLDDGAVNHRTGGLIDDADAFDNDFFGIAPREAEAMDPQQRLLLQTAWRALEYATLDPRGQAGSDTGVFVGVMANEWAHLHMSDYRTISAQDGSGNGYFMTANRLSYQLDLRGPSLAVDTACSSSLVAAHLAVQALRSGECDQAIAGGVNLTLTPALNVFYTKAGLAAPDGRCKPFSSKADGIGRGEGVAVVVLRRLSDALAAGLPVYAVIKGSAVNSDGRSNGITAPNRWAQQQVAATAYHRGDRTRADQFHRSTRQMALRLPSTYPIQTLRVLTATRMAIVHQGAAGSSKYPNTARSTLATANSRTDGADQTAGRVDSPAGAMKRFAIRVAGGNSQAAKQLPVMSV